MFQTKISLEKEGMKLSFLFEIVWFGSFIVTLLKLLLFVLVVENVINSLKILSPKDHYSFSPHSSLYISYNTDNEKLFDNQKLFKLAIILFILMGFKCDSGVVRWGEIRSQIILG